MELLKHVTKHHCKEHVNIHERYRVEDAVEKCEESLFNKQKDKVNEGKKRKKSLFFVFVEFKLNIIYIFQS